MSDEPDQTEQPEPEHFDPGDLVDWTDSHLFALTRDTTWWNKPVSGSGDWYDARRHLLMLYTIALNVNWPHPEWPAPPKPPLCLEIGVREGISTLAILHAMRETGGKLISLECDPRSANIATALVRKAQLEQWWQLEVARSEDYAKTFRQELDFLWIDGDHSREQVQMDIESYAPLVRPNGIIALHDYWSDPACLMPSTQGPFPSFVSEVVEGCRASGNFEVICLPWSFGLVLMRVL